MTFQLVLRWLRTLKNLPSEGSTPVCMEGRPSIRLARERRVPPVVRVRARCASGTRKEIVVTPLIVPMAHSDQTLLVHLFNANLDEARATRVAATVQSVFSEGKSPAVPTDLTTDSTRRAAGPLTGRELEVLRLVALGLETKEIADEFGLSPQPCPQRSQEAACEIHTSRSDLRPAFRSALATPNDSASRSSWPRMPCMSSTAKKND